MENSKTRRIYTKLTSSQLKDLLNDSSQPKIAIKFSATWCNPCKNIKEQCDKLFSELPEDYIIADIDIQ